MVHDVDESARNHLRVYPLLDSTAMCRIISNANVPDMTRFSLPDRGMCGLVTPGPNM